MKSIIRCLSMMALVALAFTSCNKNEQNEQSEQNEQKKTTFKASTEQLIVVDDDRAYIDYYNRIRFDVGDMIMLFNIDEEDPLQSNCATYEALQEGNDVEFENCGLGEVSLERKDVFFAFYPSGPGRTQTELSSGQNKSRFFISPCQEYRPNMVSLNDMYMWASDNEVDNLGQAEFNFRNIFGILRLFPFEAAQRTVTEIKIVDNYFNLSGWVELIIPEFDFVEMTSLFNNYDMNNPSYVAHLEAFQNRIGYNLYDSGNSITLNIPGGVQLGDSRSNTPAFNIVLRPLAMSQGFHIIFTFDDGSQKDIDLSDNYSLVMAPNVIRTVGLNMDAY